MTTPPPKCRQDGSGSESRPSDELPLSSSAPLEPSRLRIVDQAGTWVVTVVSASLILLTTSLIILSWIWFGRTEAERWRQLIVGPNSDLAITLTSVAIRASVATISWITACMMASVVVERYGVPPDRVAQASIVRYTGALISLMFGGYAMRRTRFKIMIPLQLACAIASQFTSTALFSDIGTMALPGFPRGMDMSYEFDAFNISEGRSPLYVAQSNYATKWSSYQPLTFETFAEYAEPGSRILADGVDDTGPIWRAFLPIGNESLRTAVREYTGVARVFDARTICVRPDIQTLEYTYTPEVQGDIADTQWRGSAVLNTSQIPNILAPETVTSEIIFSCDHHNTDRSVAPSHQWVQCETSPDDDSPGNTPRRIGSLEPLFYDTSKIDGLEADEARWLDDNGLETAPDQSNPRARMHRRRTGDGYILMDLGSTNSTAIYTAGPKETRISQKPNVTSPLSLLTSTGNGPWNDFEAEFNASEKKANVSKIWELGSISVRATYCMDVMMPIAAPVEYLNITVAGKGGFTEPGSSWLQDESRYATKDVRRQLDATDETLTASDRGILTISKESLDRAIENEIKPANASYGVTAGDASLLPRGLYTKHTLMKSLASSLLFPNDPQPFWDDFFTEAMAETGSPALATQALNTAVGRMLYTRWLPSFTHAEQADVATLVNARAPVRAAGYSLVLAMILVQVVLLVVATAMFRTCRSSTLDNVWMATAQVAASPEVEHLLSRAGTMTDAEVTRRVRGQRKGWGLWRREKLVRLAARDGVFQPVDDEERRGVWWGFRGWRRVHEKIPRPRKTERKAQSREASPSSGEEVGL